MDFRGVSKDSERADLLLFIRTLNDDLPPLPQ
jgi:cytochrome c2